ncbi:hypothetical protein GAGA_0301 [Paraglaciecola agarilytica NO2]|uniref:Transposase n=1 Tax=Paraglaciecola agarilytica NO2 TaxID=1125747 RepID=A0ABQ0I1G6_9ALTE|nr:hypothetical protein GAGA_0301 [Paraglaciecola agarilytica NO2]
MANIKHLFTDEYSFFIWLGFKYSQKGYTMGNLLLGIVLRISTSLHSNTFSACKYI